MSKKKKIIILVCSCTILFIFLIIFALFNGLEKAYYISQIIAVILAIIGGFIAIENYITSVKQHAIELEQYKLAIQQYSLSKESERNQIHNARVQKAIDLAGYYKDNILYNIIFISEVYKRLGIDEIIQSVKIEKKKEFDIKELRDIFSPKDINEIANKLNSNKLIDVVKDLCGIYIKISLDDKENNNGVYKELVNNIITETLNNLEYFALHFTYDTANEEVIYQSLHTEYLRLVSLLYYNIAIYNKSGEQKLYTSTIKLFNCWKEEAIKQRFNEEQYSRNNIRHGEKAKNIE